MTPNISCKPVAPDVDAAVYDPQFLHTAVSNLAASPPVIADLTDLLPLLMGQTDCAPDGCDVALYLARLDESFDIDAAAKRELVHFLWQLMETLIAIQFGLDPLSVARAAARHKFSPLT